MTAVVMERMPTAFSLSAAELERPNKSRPHTPPYTPNRSKVRLERADSPAPSIHPTETVSPAKKNGTATDLPDTIVVQELIEGHPEYATSVELVYPDELEEFESEADTGDVSESEGEESDNDITGRLSLLHCDDKNGEAQMARNRRERRESKRQEQRHFKRSHSQSIKSEAETTDADAMDDHDLTATARRLRRRTQGPEAMDAVSSMASRGSPLRNSPTGRRMNLRRSTDLHRPRNRQAASRSDDSDDMDTSD